MSPRDVMWNRLAEAGLVSGAPPQDASAQSPWYVTAMIGVAAWIASLFFLAFVGAAISGLLRNATGSVTTGVLICVACVFAFRAAAGRVFPTQLALAASLAGQALIGIGLIQAVGRGAAGWLVFALVEIALVAAVPNYVHRVLAMLAAAIAIFLAFAAAGLSPLYPALIAAAFVVTQHLADRAIDVRAPWSAAAIGLALAALLVIPMTVSEMFWMWSKRMHASSIVALYAGAGLLAALLVIAIAKILRDMGVAWRSPAGLAALIGGAAVGAVAWPVAGIVLALIVLLTAFASGRRVLAGFAVLAMLVALGRYYYSMDTTLLAKSAALLATGVVLLVAGFALRFLPTPKETSHA